MKAPALSATVYFPHIVLYLPRVGDQVVGSYGFCCFVPRLLARYLFMLSSTLPIGMIPVLLHYMVERSRAPSELFDVDHVVVLRYVVTNFCQAL